MSSKLNIQTNNIEFNKSKKNTFIETESFVIKRSKKFYVITTHNFLPLRNNIFDDKKKYEICINSKWNELLILKDKNNGKYNKFFTKITCKLPQIGSYALISKNKMVLIKNYCFFNYGFLPNYPKTLYIQVKVDNPKDYLSGTPLFDFTNKLLGIVSFHDDNNLYCLPSYYINKTFEKSNKIDLPDIDEKIIKVNRNIVKNNMIYNPSLGVNIPLHTYLLLESNKVNEITVTNGEIELVLNKIIYAEYKNNQIIKNSRKLEFINNYVLLSTSSFHSLKCYYPEKCKEMLEFISKAENISRVKFKIDDNEILIKN